MVKYQFGLLLFLKRRKYPSKSTKMSIYREDFVAYRDTKFLFLLHYKDDQHKNQAVKLTPNLP